jgi:hypothetical protein
MLFFFHPRRTLSSLTAPAAAATTPRTHAQVDLASDSTARLAMLAGSDGVDTIPQLHVNGKVKEKRDEADERARRSPHPRSTPLTVFPLSLLPRSQKLVGDFNACQEMEDFGELDAALKTKD